MKIINAKELTKKATINMLVYGAPGVGKTTFASTAPKPLIIDLENGGLAIAGRDVDIAQVDTIQDVIEAIKYAVNNGYKTIVIDSVTRYAELLLEDILKRNKRETARIQDWGEVVKRMKKLIWSLQSKKINIILVSLETEDKDDETIVKRPSVPGKLKTSIPGIVDIVGYMRVLKNGSRVITVKPAEKFYAKDRSGKLPEDVEPNFKKIIEIITEGGNDGLDTSNTGDISDSNSGNSGKDNIKELDKKFITGIHSWSKLADFDYKAFIKEKFNKKSSKELTEDEAKTIILEAKKEWYKKLVEQGKNPVVDLNKALSKITYKEAKKYTEGGEK